ncbi:uncharacterized protein LOC118463965 [Anopheles albimanus]|uniref:uncharacterized protein LOC118463965 n=1 Tax=Anopheles albimanus TaxID=7167 RepID=UPI00163DEE4A|nr:uncharacterized protein LOC118463965 [Anopheles albimanus]
MLPVMLATMGVLWRFIATGDRSEIGGKKQKQKLNAMRFGLNQRSHIMANLLKPITVKIERREAEAQSGVRENSPSEQLIEVIDLTIEEAEFQTFIQTLPRSTPPLAAQQSAAAPSSVISGSSSRRSYGFYALAVPIDYIEKIKLYQQFAGGELFNMSFKQLMIYGRVTQQHVKDDCTFISQLDDGTGRVDVMFRNTRKKIIDAQNKLIKCEEIMLSRDASADSTEGGYPESLHEPLKTLMAMARANCARQINQPPLGRWCFALGFPFQSTNDGITIFAHTVVADTMDGKSMDLFWKSYLLSFYAPIIGNDSIDGYGDDSINSFKSWLDSHGL